MTAIAERPERVSLHGEWMQGKVPVYALGKLDRYTRRTVSRMWHALTRAGLSTPDRNVLRAQIRDLQSVIELIQPQWPAPAEEGRSWEEIATFGSAYRNLTTAIMSLAQAAEGLLSVPAVDSVPRQFGRKAIPASAVPAGTIKDQGVATLLRDIEAAMHTIFVVGKNIHEAGLTVSVSDEAIPTAEPTPAQAPAGLTFLGRQARAAQQRKPVRV
jgi:hypothetical protein